MAMMMGPNGKALPVATGAAAGVDGGGNRGEAITSDTGNRPAVPRESRAEPKDAEEIALSAPVEPTAPEPVPVQDVRPEEIDQLHARFDSMEALLKRKLAVATLHSRFDKLEAWINERF